MPNVVSCARTAAQTIGKHFSCNSFPSVHDDDADTVIVASSHMTRRGRRFLCSAWPSKVQQGNHVRQTPKLEFDRVVMSTKILEIIEQLKPLSAMVSTILNLELLGSTRAQDITNRPKTTPNIIEPKLYGRDELKNNIIDGITHGKYCTNKLTVVPLVGPGGIGKTTLTQHIFRELEGSFQVSVRICVSLDFNADRLAEEIMKKIPKVNDEKDNSTNQEVIAQRLESKRLLLVLDDVWTYHGDEWKKLLAPLSQTGGEKGNVVIVTTRIPKVASMVTTINSSIDVERLTHEHTMSFFEVCVFGDQQPWKDHLELHDVGNKIVKKLKGFPLAAKTVGRLLRNQLTLDHWTRVAESREWELQTNDDDIMPALKLSYDYLPFHLQQCFSYCGLFPEDYEFGSKELVHFWIGLGILGSLDQAKRTEDVALCYLNDLVNHGFLRKNEKENGPRYVIHDLLHNLAVTVSSYECLSIYSSNVRTIQIPASVRHLSIIVDNADVKDITTFKEYNSYLSAIRKRLKVQNLHTLVLFGECHGNFAKTFRELVHLRYLRIKSVRNKDMCLPSALFRSYHLET
ncbi:putative disease resistance protein RGA4 [Triticum dicoccoides]|uniref:putative disease resistance protein RGA4 n=1 Tax=Triticum dicoccoides TaxID=85692 RepID=UPI00188FCCCF|nr:putative disease resistance protein RGA4 [Triticum dicoccoides]